MRCGRGERAELRKFEGHTDRVRSVSFSGDGKQVVSGSWDKTVRVWDTQTGKSLPLGAYDIVPVSDVPRSLDDLENTVGIALAEAYMCGKKACAVDGPDLHFLTLC